MTGNARSKIRSLEVECRGHLSTIDTLKRDMQLLQQQLRQWRELMGSPDPAKVKEHIDTLNAAIAKRSDSAIAAERSTALRKAEKDKQYAELNAYEECIKIVSNLHIEKDKSPKYYVLRALKDQLHDRRQLYKNATPEEAASAMA